MSDKSYVTLEQHVCPICVKTHDTNALLIDCKLRNTFDMHTVTGFGICPECRAQIDKGYIALVVADPEKTPTRFEAGHERCDPQDAYRTGEIIFIRKTVADQLFTPPFAGEMAFIAPDAAEKIRSMMPAEV